MDEGSAESARTKCPPSSAAPGETSNLPAITSLALGILALPFQFLAWGDWMWGSGVRLAVVSTAISVAAGISAIVFGAKGRRLANAGAQSRITATIGLVLGIVALAIPIVALLAFIVWIGCCMDTL